MMPRPYDTDANTAPACNVPPQLAASVQHLETIESALASLRAKIARLEEARKQTMEQIVCASKRLAYDERWDSEAMFRLYEELKTPGFFTAWKSSGLPHPAKLRADVQAMERHRPNDPASGGWVGEWVNGAIQGNCPEHGRPVVYVLYGADAEPVYCGSSEQFAKRLDAHYRDGKRFVAWRAVPCQSREEAFKLEDQLLKQHCPPLNKRAGR